MITLSFGGTHRLSHGPSFLGVVHIWREFPTTSRLKDALMHRSRYPRCFSGFLTSVLNLHRPQPEIAVNFITDQILSGKTSPFTYLPRYPVNLVTKRSLDADIRDAFLGSPQSVDREHIFFHYTGLNLNSFHCMHIHQLSFIQTPSRCLVRWNASPPRLRILT